MIMTGMIIYYQFLPVLQFDAAVFIFSSNNLLQEL